MIVHFSYKGARLDITWPPASGTTIRAKQPDYDIRRYTSVVRVHEVGPHDRIYLSHFYDALAYVLENDGRRGSPQITTIDGFAELHNASLSAAVDRDHVGIYPNLMDCVWEAIFAIVGVQTPEVDAEGRQRLIEACSALAWRFAIHEG